MLGMGVVAPLLPLYAQDFGASGFLIGLTFGSFSLARIAFSPLVGREVDRRGKKPLILYGLGLFIFSSLAYLVSWDIGSLLAARTLQGVAAALLRSHRGDDLIDTRIDGQRLNHRTSVYSGRDIQVFP